MFGDIITVARGKVEVGHDGDYNLIQSDSFKCERLCDDDADQFGRNVTALWMVEKIRHRDLSRGHRYEMRITIMPTGARKSRSSKELQTDDRKGRSFILRDKDYPKYFSIPRPELIPPPIPQPSSPRRAYKKSEVDRTFNIDFGLRRPLYPQSLPFPFNNRPDLNMGEIYMRPPTNIPQNYMPSIQTYPTGPFFQFNTPNYFKFDHLKNYNTIPETTSPIRFPDTNNQISGFNSPNIAQHLHHHYFLNKNNVPLVKATTVENQFFGDHRGTTEIYREPYKYVTPFIPDEFKTHQPDFNNFQTPQIFTNQIPAPNGYFKNQFTNLFNQNPTPTYNAIQQPVTIGHYPQPLQIPASPSHAPYIPFIDPSPSPSYPLDPRQNGHSIPFRESPKFETQNKYSDPDPLYHPLPEQHQQHNEEQHQVIIDSSRKPNYGNSNKKKQENYDIITANNNPNTLQYDDDHKTKLHRHSNKYPDSINAQLPPPDKGTDTKVPYVETTVVTEKSASPPLIIVPSISVNEYPPKDRNTDDQKSKPNQNANPRSSPATKLADKAKTKTNLRQHYRTTTEKPIIKWMPKRRRPISSTNTTQQQVLPTKLYSSRIPHFDPSKVENYITIQPQIPSPSSSTQSSIRATNHDHRPTISAKLPNARTRKGETSRKISENLEPESPTRKSFSTSVSVEVGKGNTSNKRRLFDELRPRLRLKGGNNNNDDKVEMVKADIQTLRTNSKGMHLFRASDEVTNGDGDVDSDPIAASILKHAKSISDRSDRRKYRRQ